MKCTKLKSSSIFNLLMFFFFLFLLPLGLQSTMQSQCFSGFVAKQDFSHSGGNLSQYLYAPWGHFCCYFSHLRLGGKNESHIHFLITILSLANQNGNQTDKLYILFLFEYRNDINNVRVKRCQVSSMP